MMRRKLLGICVVILSLLTQISQPAVADTVANTVISAKLNGAVYSFEISHPESATCTVYTSAANNNCQIPISYRVTSQNSNNMFYGNGIALDESNVKVGFFGFTTFLDSPSPNWKSSSIYVSMANSGRINLTLTGTNDYTYQVVSRKSIDLKVSTTAPTVKLFDFNPLWDNSVLEHKVIYSKYSLGNSTSMVVGFPTKIRSSGECATVVFHLAPVDYLKKESPASASFKKYAAFSIDIWTNDGLKLASLDSRDSTNFFAPTLITQVPIKLCDKVFSSGREVSLKLAFKTGVSIVYGDIVEFNENLLVVGNSVANKPTISSKTTITCIKGKLTKKVTAAKPKCPNGYKLKK
jgi:hypothetical protein